MQHLLTHLIPMVRRRSETFWLDNLITTHSKFGGAQTLLGRCDIDSSIVFLDDFVLSHSFRASEASLPSRQHKKKKKTQSPTGHREPNLCLPSALQPVTAPSVCSRGSVGGRPGGGMSGTMPQPLRLIASLRARAHTHKVNTDRIIPLPRRIVNSLAEITYTKTPKSRTRMPISSANSRRLFPPSDGVAFMVNEIDPSNGPRRGSRQFRIC